MKDKPVTEKLRAMLKRFEETPGDVAPEEVPDVVVFGVWLLMREGGIRAPARGDRP